MNILTVVFGLSKGGTEKAAQLFAQGYAKLGHSSKLLSLYHLGPRYEELKNSIQIFDGLNSKNIKLIKNWRPDIIHIHSHGIKLRDITILLETLKSQNLKVIETNVFSYPTPWSSKLDLSFQLSSWCQWLYEKRGGMKIPKAIVPNMINPDFFYPRSNYEVEKFRDHYKIPRDAFVIGRIGQPFKGKWSHFLIDAFNELSDSNENLYLLIVNAPVNITDLAKKSKNYNRIVIIDKLIGDQNLSIAYSSMNIFYLTAEQGESFGNVILESILSGTPVIALATPWGDNSQIEVLQNNIGGNVVHCNKSAIKLIKEYNNGNRNINFEIAINSILKNYEYIKVCQKALKYTNSKNYTQPISNKKIIKILKNSYDKPNFLTVLLLKFNLEKLTIYSSGYKNWASLILRLYYKCFKFLKN